MLKAVVESLDEVPESLRQFYSEKDGKFVLQMEGAELESEVRGLKSALQKERDAAKQLKAEIAELQSKFKDLDPEAARKALEQQQALKEKQLLDAGKVDEVVAERTAMMRRDFEAQTKALKAALEERDSALTKQAQQLETHLIDGAVSAAALELGARKEALELIKLKAKQTFRVKDGRLVPVNGEGGTVYGKDGRSPLSVKEYLEGLKTEASFLFQPSSGGGAKSGTEVVGGALTLSREDARDPIKYRAAREQAAKLGVPLRAEAS